MPGDYIPTTDGDLVQWANNFVSTVAANAVAVGVLEADSDALETKVTAFQTSLTNHVNAQTAAQAATQAKNAARDSLVTSARAMAKQIQARPTVTDALRADLGITIPASNQTSVGVPTTAPVISINTGSRLQHIINFQDEMTPTSRAKPAGVLGCEIRRFVGAAQPASPDDYQFIGLDTATPFLTNFSESDGGKKAFYIARWQNRAGQGGPWSAVASATVVA